MLVQYTEEAKVGAATSTPQIVRLADRQPAADLVAEWRALAASIESSSYFQTPDWVLSWWEHSGRPPTEVALWRDNHGCLEAVAFLSQTRERLHRRIPFAVRLTTNAGSGRPYSADHCGWPVLPHRVPDVQRWIATHPWGTSRLLRHLDPETGVPCVPGGAHRVLTTVCPRLRIPDDPAKLSISSHFRQRMRRSQRELEHAGVAFTWRAPGTVTTEALDILFTVSESRRSLKGSTSFVRADVEDFHRRLIARSGPGRGPAMVIAHRGERPVAAMYGFMWRDTFAIYQGGWDAAWASLSLGSVLVAESIRLAGLNGAKCFDFLRGTEAYKYRFGATDRLDETWLLPSGLGGVVTELKFAGVRMRRGELIRRAQPK